MSLLQLLLGLNKVYSDILLLVLLKDYFLLHQFLLIPGARGFQFETLALDPLLEEALTGFLAPADNHRTVTRIPRGLPCIRADRAKFQQTLLSLLSNAQKFSPPGRRHRVDVLGEHPDGLALVGIAVRDHGIGMNAEEIALQAASSAATAPAASRNQIMG